ncbi:PKD domain-containing protein [Shewanella submarina]|uniref:M14 family zinc carboxypeptidase n=1 Tax=Shewanella submarina TaxID=2016376 RepID=A0ABV7GLA0_9GAMM|nr:M14 family zinc carboxypeptidase [Shewanella submarina]MCL1039606.1 PKD domain-containing protein [Shewanella submarina]
MKTPGLTLPLLLSAAFAAPAVADPVYRLEFNDKTRYQQAGISLHSQLLKSDSQALVHWAELDAETLEKLQTLGIKMAPDKRVTAPTGLSPEAVTSLNATQSSGIPGYACYPTVEETFDAMDSLVSQYPKLASLTDIGDSWLKQNGIGGFDLKVLKLTNEGTSGDKPKLFIHAAMHAREYATSPLALDFATHLLQTYETDADSQWILDRHEIHLLLHMNPDGRKEAEKQVYWRKNMNQSVCSNPDAKGVDLNRNFSWGWNTTGGVGSSGNQCAETYRGQSAASEPETQAVEAYLRNLFGDHRGPNRADAAPADTPGMHIDIHSYSELVLWPWGDVDTPAPNGTALQTLGRKLARFNGYTPIQSVGLYPTDGTSDDISYGELGIAHFTFELGTAFFQACDTYNSKVKPDNLKALKYAAKVVKAPYLIPAGPDITAIKLNDGDDFSIPVNYDAKLQVTSSDARFNNSRGTEPTQAISQIQLFINNYPEEINAQPITLSPTDGSYDEVTESAGYSLDLTELGEGKHRLYLRSSDTSGQFGSVSAMFLNVTAAANRLPIADFSVSCDKLKCDFDASNSSDPDGSISSYQWQFGDGETGSGQSLSHDYAEGGSFTVTLTVTDDAGAQQNSQKTATPVGNQKPVASFSISCTELSCSADATGSSDPDGSIASYSWNWGDGSSSSGDKASHSYSSGGSYQVQLTVTDNEGATQTNSRNVSVSQPSSGGSGGGSLSLWLLALLLLIPTRTAVTSRE